MNHIQNLLIQPAVCLNHCRFQATHMHCVANHFEAVTDVFHEPVASAQVLAQWVTQVVARAQFTKHRHHSCRDQGGQVKHWPEVLTTKSHWPAVQTSNHPWGVTTSEIDQQWWQKKDGPWSGGGPLGPHFAVLLDRLELMAIQFCIIFCTTRQLHSICCHNQWWIWTNCPWWTCWFSEFLSVSVHSQACVCHYSCQWVFSCHSQVCACHYSCQWVFTCHSQECLSLLLSVSVSCHSQESACHYSCQWVFTCHSQESACHYSCQ